MAKIKAPAGTNLPLNQATIRVRGRFIIYNHKGQQVAASWPRKRPGKPSQAQLEQRQEFARMAEATKFIDPIQQQSARLMAEGSKYVWRDLVALAMTGQLGDFPNYGEIVSQYTLDILGQEPGMIIIRAAEWIALVKGEDTQVLTMQDGLPAWVGLPDAINELSGDVIAGPGGGNQTATLASTGVTPGTYELTTLTVDAKGRITDALSGTSTPYIDELSGDVSAGPGSGNVTAILASTGVTPGTYTLSTLTVDAKGRVTAASSGAAAGAGTIAHPGFASGRYYTAELSQTLTQLIVSPNRLYAVPFYVGKTFTFTKMSCFVTLTASGNIELGVYSNNNGAPDQLVHDCGSVAIPGNNLVAEITGRSINLSPGWYWLALAASAAPAIRSTTGAEGTAWNTIGSTNVGNATVAYTGCNAAWTFSAGNLPATFPTPTFTVSTTPICFIGS